MRNGTRLSVALAAALAALPADAGAATVATGAAHSVVVDGSGNVWAWGDNASGQLGTGNTTPSPLPIQVSGLSSIVAVAAGDAHTLVLASDGKVWAFGENGDGQLGDGTNTDRTSAVQVLTGASAIAAGAAHSLALKPDGTVMAWGRNNSGQLGDGTTTANGNLTQKVEGTDTWAYEWDAENQLRRVLKNSVEQARFTYDPKGRRVEKIVGGVTASYTYDGGDILRETSGPTSLKYVHGPLVDEPLADEDATGVLTHFQTDGSGSIVKTTNSTGAVTATRRYDPFGNLQASATNGHAFTGREWDSEFGLYYYRARYYDSTTGRFISEDPARFEGGLNLYNYVGSNPIRFTDPLGLKPKLTDYLYNPVKCNEGNWTAIHTAILMYNGDFGNRDRRAHCLAFCHIRKACGPFWGGLVLTTAIGVGKEAFDTFCFYWLRPEVAHHFGGNVRCYSPWDPDDIDANYWGAACDENRSCDEHCQRF